MAYRAYLNGRKFFDTSSPRTDQGLINASIQYTAGSAGEFTFTVPKNNVCYNNFLPLISNYIKDYIVVYKGNELIFSCRVTSCTFNFDLSVDVVCEGMLAVLNDSLLSPVNFGKTYDEETGTWTGRDLHNLQDIFTYIILAHNSMVPSDKKVYIGYITNETKEDYYIDDEQLNFTSPETALGMIESVVELTKGYISIYRDPDHNWRLTFEWRSNFDLLVSDQSVVLSENLIDITYSRDMTDFATCIFAYGATIDDDVTTIRPDDPETAAKMAQWSSEYWYATSNGNIYIYNIAAVNRYGPIYTIKTFDYRTTSLGVYLSAVSYLRNSSVPYENIEVRAVDLSNAGYNIDQFRVGYKVPIKSDPHYIPNNYQIVCSEKSIDLLNPSSDDLSFNTYIKRKSRLISSNIFG